MSFVSKTSSLQAYHTLVYRGALHPEFFAITDRRRIRHGAYEFEMWISQGNHALRFEYDDLCISEITTDRPESMPDRGLVTSLPCAGEKDHDADFSERVSYVTSMQTELLSGHLYQSTFNELFEHGRECEALMYSWREDGGKPNMSMLDIQRYFDEVHVQAYHLRSDCGLVLRTQSIFQIK